MALIRLGFPCAYGPERHNERVVVRLALKGRKRGREPIAHLPEEASLGIRPAALEDLVPHDGRFVVTVQNADGGVSVFHVRVGRKAHKRRYFRELRVILRVALKQKHPFRRKRGAFEVMQQALRNAADEKRGIPRAVMQIGKRCF